ncbi:molybdenum ABC transporter ATP-binding protein ModC [Vibrio sp. SCSIO 43136]|uniref:molybdenum ABC transporter ATP-binding protein ModC n=1 Tax=Vibrio sp. SCSIO 43136 TaxID=2819101 RepID=UPI002075C051|nr:molybdenum ABC transporter ATP-binding protein ModC [Vibrio sp. SCSIO 43136]USD68242.1 molybdenum ABC transporter ATP-binding protein ModC [Vibrio sp. SCSIO 43136]
MININIEQSLGELGLKISCKLPGKGITAVFGRSGAGKTSFINAISGLTNPDRGTIEVNGRVLFDSHQGIDVPVEHRRIGYVFQESRLFPHYSVHGNLTYGSPKELDLSEFDTTVELLGIRHLLARKPHQLSGGEKQRVAIARALLSKPSLLIMDEPLASLDLPRKREVMPYLEQLSQHLSVPIVYVTHSLNEILRLADHMLVLEKGKLLSCGSLENVWQSQAMKPWQSFSEQSTVFEATVCHHHEQYSLTQIALSKECHLWVQRISAPIDGSVRVQVRANDVSISLIKPELTSIRNIIPATISAIETQGGKERSSVSIGLKVAGDKILWANLTQWAVDDLKLKVGSSVYAQLKGVSVTQRDIVAVPMD